MDQWRKHLKNEQGETLTIDIAPNDDVRALWMEIQAELKDRDLNKAKLVFNGLYQSHLIFRDICLYHYLCGLSYIALAHKFSCLPNFTLI